MCFDDELYFSSLRFWPNYVLQPRSEEKRRRRKKYTQHQTYALENGCQIGRGECKRRVKEETTKISQSLTHSLDGSIAQCSICVDSAYEEIVNKRDGKCQRCQTTCEFSFCAFSFSLLLSYVEFLSTEPQTQLQRVFFYLISFRSFFHFRSGVFPIQW